MLDRPPDLLEHEPARRQTRRPPGWAVAVAALAVLIGVTRLTSRESPAPDTPPAPPVATTQPAPLAPAGRFGVPLADVPGLPADLAATRSALYVVQVDPPRVLRLLPGGRSGAQAAAPSDPSGIALDEAAGIGWVWSTTITATVVRTYDLRTLRVLGTQQVEGPLFAAAALGGRLYLGQQRGVLRLGRAGPQGWVARGQVFGVTAAGGLLYATVGTSVLAIDPRDGRVLGRQVLRIGKASVAVVGADVWVGGFSTDSTVLVHLRGPRLRPAEPVRYADELSPGAIVWPGASVVWVRDGGTEALACLDPRTGRPLARWGAVVGPVTSVRGRAYAIDQASVVPLPVTGRCRG